MLFAGSSLLGGTRLCVEYICRLYPLLDLEGTCDFANLTSEKLNFTGCTAE